ncbi:F-box/LRR-repeat protein 8 isoform X1 [Polypterus senegalus]|nr:F-box/LRR-repeat protein 8 isoform X1 [Polypterus senegalus]
MNLQFCFNTMQKVPVEILANIFSYLPFVDRHAASLVCKKWYHAIQFPTVWYFTEVSFEIGTEENTLQKMCQFLPKVRHLKIVLNQAVHINRKNAIETLKYATDSSNNIQVLCIACRGENPLFYSGQDILRGISDIFQNKSAGLRLREIDFRHMPFMLDDYLVRLIASKNPNLHRLYINNQTLVCNVTKDSVRELLRLCQELSVLGVFYASISEDVIHDLMKPERPNFLLLELFCERLDKYIPAITNDLWEALHKRHPFMAVDMVLDHTLPKRKMTRILQPAIPVRNLELITYTYLVNEVQFTASNYSTTLEKLVLQTTSSEELNAALIDLASVCASLKEIHCYCVVSAGVIQAFTTCCPKLWRYTLKVSKEPHPWLCTVVR